ncbi:ribonuclease H, partial [Trifolium pratense]
ATYGNRDGAYKEGSATGCGGVICDSNGVWRGGFAKNLGLCSAYVAELWGVFEGLKYAIQKGYNKIEVNVDYMVVDHVIRSKGIGSLLEGALISRNRQLLDLD